VKSQLISRLLELPRGGKRAVAILLDTTLSVASFWAALYLRLGEWVPIVGNNWIALGIAVILAITALRAIGFYNSVFRHSGSTIDPKLLHVCLGYGAIYSLLFTFIGIDGVPRTVGIIQPILLFLAVAASRAAIYALLANRHGPRKDIEVRERVLIFGAGNTGRHLVRELRRDRTAVPVCFVDDDPSLQNGKVESLMVHAPDRVRDLVEQLDINKVLLALPAQARRRRRELLHELLGSKAEIQTLPGVSDILRGDIRITDLRPLTISDLLGRPAVAPNPDLIERDGARATVMVTGAGGSIGSELARQILAVGPARLILLDSSEFALYTIHRELEEQMTDPLGNGANGNILPEIVPILASVCDQRRINAVMQRYRPQTIYHAAAYKHVPLVEQNALEGLRNNVFGTDNMAMLAAKYGVRSFVLVSTDKAVRPTNVMGASKRLSEQAVQARAALKSATRFSVVRFGNVLGSSGSVVPLFRHQIAHGGPLTVTHRDVTRYFMTIPEAAQLVLQAGAMGSRGEVFVLDMGEPVRVWDLAVNMIELSGYSLKSESHPEGDVEIRVVGLRPGEKLYEELLIGNDPQPTMHPRIMQANEPYVAFAELQRHLENLADAIARNDLGAALATLQATVPEYAPDGRIVDHLHRLAQVA